MKRPLPDEIVTNRLLDTLPAKVRKRIVGACETVARGDVAILDRKGLEHGACQCYRWDITSYQQVMGQGVQFAP